MICCILGMGHLAHMIWAVRSSASHCCLGHVHHTTRQRVWRHGCSHSVLKMWMSVLVADIMPWDLEYLPHDMLYFSGLFGAHDLGGAQQYASHDRKYTAGVLLWHIVGVCVWSFWRLGLTMYYG